MEVCIKNIGNNYKFKVSFDKYGNLYLSSDNVDYQLGVDSHNKPILEEGLFEIIKKEDFDFVDLIHKPPRPQLQVNIEKALIEEYGRDPDDEGIDEEIFEEEEEYYVDPYFDENKMENDFYDIYENNSEDDADIIDEDNGKMFGYDNVPYKFYKEEGFSIDVYDRCNGDVCPLYDTYIYDNNKLSFISYSANNSSIYRLKLYSDGVIGFRLIGEEEKNYVIGVQDGNPIILH